MDNVDFITIVRYAWIEYDSSRRVVDITDISVMVSTNHVYKISLEDGNFVIAKLSHFGKYEDFVEDHTIINVLSNNLPFPFEYFLSRSLMKGDSIFIHRFKNYEIDAAIVFYRPIKINLRPPRKMNLGQIITLGKQVAEFHKACHLVRHTLPPSSKSLLKDIGLIEDYIRSPKSIVKNEEHKQLVLNHCGQFKKEVSDLSLNEDDLIPVFIDWNIGNFSVDANFCLFSRWDYDWFRTTTRVLDFYFLSRVVSEAGDQTAFTYNMSTLQEERFITFLQSYHQIFPLKRTEVLMIKEAYRFFILNYVIRHGGYFFNAPYADQLREDALNQHLHDVDTFNSELLINALNIEE